MFYWAAKNALASFAFASFFEMTAEYRLEEAKRLLREKINIKVEEIAEEVGYNSKSSFNAAFKKITGKTPSEWRVE